MTKNIVYDKTAKGREEIATRKYQLAPRLRTLLILIDGKHGMEYLLSKVAGIGLHEESLASLLEDGFIESVESSGMPETTPGIPGAIGPEE